MARSKTASFILELQLHTELHQEHLLNKRFDIARRMYNKVLSYALKQRNKLLSDKGYIETLAMYRKEKDEKIKKELSHILSDRRIEYYLSEYALHDYIKVQQHIYKKHIDSFTAQKIASTVWKAISDVLFSDGKRVKFKKYGYLASLEGKSNATGIRFVDNHLVWNGLKIPVRIQEKDYYAHEALTHKVKFCRIVKKVVGKKYKYYLQLVMEGIPPNKGFVYSNNENKVGIDPGTSSMAIVSEKGAMLIELAPKVKGHDYQLTLINAKMERSRRVTNPDNYNKDGTIKRGVRLHWYKSKKYKKLQMQYKDTYRRRTAYIKESHLKNIKLILSLGTDIYTETMNYRALAKRSKKETEINKRTGRCKRKKRFGKSLGAKAPSQFLTLLEQKLKYIEKPLNKVTTQTFKASQYNHLTDTYIKKPLSQRWNNLNGLKVQRDLYSAFLLMNSKKTLKETNRKDCLKSFSSFICNHDECLSQLMRSNEPKLGSFGLLK